MDDFRVGSVPSAEPYGDRHTYGSVGRKRQKHHDEPSGGEQEPADTFEATAESEEATAEPDEPVADYYLPSEPEDREE
jgi:hypothetical protein